MICEVCGGKYIATRKGSHYCSNRCRAQASNERRVKDGTKSKTVYVPTGRSRGRPRKDTEVKIQTPPETQNNRAGLGTCAGFSGLNQKEPSPEVKAEMERREKDLAERIKKSEGLPGEGMFTDQKDQDLEEWRAKRAEQKKKDREKVERWLDETLGG